MTLTRAQYDALYRVLEAIPSGQRGSVKNVHIEYRYTYVRVTFDAGWGQASFDIDEDGNSEHVAFGESPISAEHGA